MIRGHMAIGPRNMSPALTHAPAANTAAVVTLSAVAGRRHVIAGLYFGYDSAPTGGALTITDDGNTVFQVPITSEGLGFLPFDPPVQGTAGKAVVVTLAAGDSGVSGKLNLNAWTE